MSDILDKVIVLALNKAWQPINLYTVKKAVVSLTSGVDNQPPLHALDIGYELDADGKPTERLSYATPVPWERWIGLEVRPHDMFIETSRGRIRVPTVVVCAHYAGMPEYRPRPNAKSIFDRDSGICQYSGIKVGRAHGNLDHVVPRDRGGRDTFENLVWCSKKINSDKGNKLNHEAGLTLIRPPRKIKAIPRSMTFTEARHPDWKPFIIAK